MPSIGNGIVSSVQLDATNIELIAWAAVVSGAANIIFRRELEEERDRAFADRFRPNGVEEPAEGGTVRMLASTGRSLMPEGLEGAVSPQAMADLVAFLKSRN